MLITNPSELVPLIKRVHSYIFGNDIVSNNEIILMLGTIATESGWRNGKFIRRQINGPARGIVQMEPNTGYDIFNNYIKRKPEYLRLVVGIWGGDLTKYQISKALETNDEFAVLMERLFYLRVPERIPITLNDIADYYKKYYNTPKGKGSASRFISQYNIFKCEELLHAKG